MAGSWMSIVHGFAGMRVVDGQLVFSPKLPQEWQGYAFNLYFRKHIINVKVNQAGAQFSLIKGQELTILVDGQAQTLTK